MATVILSAQTSEAPKAVTSVVDTDEIKASALAADKRAYGVLPNYRMADANAAFVPLTSHQKLMIGVKDSFDGASFPLAAFFSGIAQFNNTNPGFGQGMKGYAHRYATAFADQVSGNMLTESVLPIAFHEDPRYFRKGAGTIKGRTWYAVTRVVVCKSDRGTSTFNGAEVVGNGMVGLLGNGYYPDSRGVSNTMQRMTTQIGTDAVSNVLKEFWPDVKAYFVRRHREKLDHQQKAAPVHAD